MANKVLHKKSNSVVGGVPSMPQPSQLEYGEIAINYNDGNEAIVIKNDANEIVSFPTYEQVQSLRCFIEGSVPSAIISANGSNTASSQYSFAVGLANAATGNTSFAEGNLTRAYGDVSHAEGQGTTAGSAYAHAEGLYTKTTNQAEHAQGRYNVSHYNQNTVSAQTIHSVGIGTSSANTMNAFEIMGDGGIYVYGVGEYLGSSIASADTLQRYLEKNEFVVATALNELNDDISNMDGNITRLGNEVGEIANTVSGLTSQTSTYELKANKVTTMSSASTHDQYPSAKLVYDTIVDNEYVVAQAINNLNSRITNFPCATTSTYGVIKVGNFLSVSDGVLSVATGTSSTTVARGNHNHGTASTSSYGVMKVGSYLTASNGVVSVNVGTASGTVAAGDHTHTTEEIGAAASAHTHDIGDIPAQTKLTSVDTEVPTGKAVIDYIEDLIVSPVNYKGAITTGSVPASANTKVGDLYIVQSNAINLTAAQSATGAAQTAETGDYIIARTKSTWDVVQKNLNGAVTSSVNLTADKFVLGDGNQTIKQSTYGPGDFSLSGHTHNITAITNGESVENKVTELTSAATDTQYPSAKAVYDAFVDNEFVVATALNDLNDNKESIANKVTSISSTATNTEYPSALAVYNYVQSQGGGGSGTDPNALTGVTVNGTAASVSGKVAEVVLPTASTSAYGMVEVGSFLSVSNGVVSVATGTSNTTVARGDHSHSTYATTTNFNSHSGDTTVHVTTTDKSNWNGKISGVTLNGVAGSVTGSVAALTLPTGSTTSFGVLKVGSFLGVTDGVVTVSTGTSNTTVARGDHSHNLDNISDGTTRVLPKGNANIYYGTCASDGSATTKVVVCTAFTNADLVKGATILVTFDNLNSGAVGSLKMNVNSTGDLPLKKIYGSSTTVSNLNHAQELKSNITYMFVYDGTNWVCATLDYNTNTTYSGMTIAEATAGTSTTNRLINPSILKQTVEYHMTQNQADWNTTDSGATSYIKNKPAVVTGVTVNGTAATVTNGVASVTVSGLPAVTASDNGKILRVVNGAWALVDPVTVYTGAATPSSSLGEDGDIYLQTD